MTLTKAQRYLMLETANRYLQGERPARVAAAQLKGKGPYGAWLAGEILLDEAARLAKPAHYWSMASGQFKTAVSQTEPDAMKEPEMPASRLRSQMRLSQLGVMQTVYGLNQMPKPRQVKRMYRSLIYKGRPAAEQVSNNSSDTRESARDLRGALGELAVLLLSQRYALREADCREWLPLQSLYSEDSGGDCTIETDQYAWDLNVFTSGERDMPKPTYGLQIKTIDEGKIERGPTLRILSDLALFRDEPRIVTSIVFGCNFEIQSPELAGRVTRELDQRTEKLLEFFD